MVSSGTDRLTDHLDVTLTPEMKSRLEQAARSLNVSVSAWVRMVLTRALKEELGEIET